MKLAALQQGDLFDSGSVVIFRLSELSVICKCSELILYSTNQAVN